MRSCSTPAPSPWQPARAAGPIRPGVALTLKWRAALAPNGGRRHDELLRFRDEGVCARPEGQVGALRLQGERRKRE